MLPEPKAILDVLPLVVALGQADEVFLLPALDVLQHPWVAKERRRLREAEHVRVERLDDGIDVLHREVVHPLQTTDIVVVELQEALSHRALIGPEPIASAKPPRAREG